MPIRRVGGGRTSPDEKSADHAGPADLIGRDALFPLPPLEATRHRRALFAETMRLAAPLLDPHVPVQRPPLSRRGQMV